MNDQSYREHRNRYVCEHENANEHMTDVCFVATHVTNTNYNSTTKLPAFAC